MRDGFKLSGSVVYFIKAINTIVYQQEEIFSVASEWISKMGGRNPLILERITKYANGNINTDDDWMSNKNYSPKIGDKLRREELNRKLIGINRN